MARVVALQGFHYPDEVGVAYAGVGDRFTLPDALLSDYRSIGRVRELSPEEDVDPPEPTPPALVGETSAGILDHPDVRAEIDAHAQTIASLEGENEVLRAKLREMGVEIEASAETIPEADAPATDPAVTPINPDDDKTSADAPPAPRGKTGKAKSKARGEA